MDNQMMILIAMTVVALAAGAAGYVLLSMLLSRSPDPDKRIARVAGSSKSEKREKAASLIDRLGDSKRDGRRKQIEESLKKLEEQERERKRKLTLKVRLQRAGLTVNEKQFFAYSALIGLVIALGAYLALGGVLAPGMRILSAAGAFVVGAVGLPLWYISFLANRRQQKFLHDLPDAIDIIVRGLRSGMPLADAMATIAREMPPPIGPEFTMVVEGLKVSIPIEQGIERMYERMPLPEVNFLSIVISIQRQTGGNLSETLGNLSRVLRGRKKMKQKVKAVSQEAKASAAIIGSLPFIIMGALSVLNPGYLNPLWNTAIGNYLVIGSVLSMATGVAIMAKMINFKV